MKQHRADITDNSARQSLFSPTSGGSGGIFSRLLFSRGFTATPSHWDLFVGQFFSVVKFCCSCCVLCFILCVIIFSFVGHQLTLFLSAALGKDEQRRESKEEAAWTIRRSRT